MVWVLLMLVKEYWAYLCIFFIIATGMCFLETAANPYVTVLGTPETASRRLNLAQSFNGLGAFIAAMFLSKLILSGSHYTRETLPVDYPGGWQAYIQLETDAMKLPYLILALLLLAIAFVFIFSKLPKIGDEDEKVPIDKKEKLIDFGVLKHSHLRWGVIAQFFYNGGQTAINSLFLVYCCTYAGLPEDTATTFFGLYMLAFLLGRWIGTGLMVKFRPQDMLLLYALMNILLCGVVMIYGGMIGFPVTLNTIVSPVFSIWGERPFTISKITSSFSELYWAQCFSKANIFSSKAHISSSSPNTLMTFPRATIFNLGYKACIIFILTLFTP